jgi:hypothetical protein
MVFPRPAQDDVVDPEEHQRKIESGR